ncbi:MAG: hypothetical protein PVF17_11755, partial [Ignavibacteria bacterium]
MKMCLSLIVLLLVCISCNNEIDIIFPAFTESSILEGSTPVPDSAKQRMKGVYLIQGGNEIFGDVAVITWNDPNFLSIYCQLGGGFIILSGGVRDSSLLFEGTWRKPFGTETGLARFIIPKEGGGAALLSDTTSELNILLSGFYGSGNNSQDKNIRFIFLRPFSQAV